jgi:hypothetical protein
MNGLHLLIRTTHQSYYPQLVLVGVHALLITMIYDSFLWYTDKENEMEGVSLLAW